MKQTPFIKLLQTPRGFYFFDVNRDAVKSVSEECYRALEQILNGDMERLSLPEIVSLQQEGYLSDHRPSVIEHPLTEHIEAILHHQMYHLCLQVTQSCNLSCIYCPYASNTTHEFSRTHAPKIMTFEIAKSAIDYLAANSSASPIINLSFYGGEPLIAYPLIRQCIEYAEQVFSGKEIQYLITTNATLLTDEMIEYFAQHHMRITFSLDGPQQIHDRHRVRPDGSPTYQNVIDKLERVVKRYGEKQAGEISVNMVLNPSDPLDQTMEWLQSPLLQHILIRASLIENDMLEHKFAGSVSYDENFNYRLALSFLNYLDLVRGFPRNVIVDSIRARFVSEYSDLQAESGGMGDVVAPSGPCVPGGKKLFVSVDGTFYPCEKVNELSEGMKIGTVSTGIDLRKATEMLNIGRLSANACADCWALTHCSVCERGADDGHALSAKAKLSHCKSSRDAFLSTLRYYLLMKECKTIYHFAPDHARQQSHPSTPDQMVRFLRERGDQYTGQEAIVIAVGALMKGIDTAHGVTGLYHALRAMGYRVGMITADPSCQEADAYQLPISLSDNLDHDVVAINQYFNWFQLEHRPDIILLQLPNEGLHRLTNAIETCFGVYTYMISQAVDIDYCVMYSPALLWSADDYSALSAAARNRFGFSYDAICVIPKIVNLAEQVDESTVPYTLIEETKVATEVDTLRRTGSGDVCYCLATDNWYQTVADDILHRLS